jgi:UDP-N-acetyl-2-amino-2-deoxyglucuronate dehydrogenase
MKRFAIIGVGGYIAPRHLQAIKATGNSLVAALDKSDSVGILDKYFPDARFFVEFERFDRHLEKLRRQPGEKVDFVTICSPNYLHDAHVRFALRIGADAISEKPLVLNPWNVAALAEIEKETGAKVNTIMQLRHHPSIIKLKEKFDSSTESDIHHIDLTYITSRGPWYQVSWKGDASKSGGVTTNIGIHFFDMLSWIFGSVKSSVVHLSNENKASGVLHLDRAHVRWFLSLDRNDLPSSQDANKTSTYRSLTIDDKEIDFSQGFADLHTVSYQEILQGNGFGLKDVLPSIQIVSSIRDAQPVGLSENGHPMLQPLQVRGEFNA